MIWALLFVSTVISFFLGFNLALSLNENVGSSKEETKKHYLYRNLVKECCNKQKKVYEIYLFCSLSDYKYFTHSFKKNISYDIYENVIARFLIDASLDNYSCVVFYLKKKEYIKWLKKTKRKNSKNNVKLWLADFFPESTKYLDGKGKKSHVYLFDVNTKKSSSQDL